MEPNVEPIEPVEPVEPVEPTEPIEPVEPPDDTPPKKSVQARIDELTFKRREAEREAEYWRKKASEKEPPKPSNEGRPRQENYETVEDYEDALFDWRDKKREAEAILTNQQKQMQVSISKFRKNAAELKKVHADFDEVVESPVFTDPMKKVLFDIDNGPLVAYHIAKNRDVAKRIQSLPPEMQVYEIGRLETQLLLAQKAKKTTTAPEPITPVGSTGAPEIEPSKMSTEEWMEYEKNRELEKLKAKLGG